MNIKQALDAAPPTPACFGDRRQWAEYLLQCQEFTKRKSARPFTDAVVYQPAFNFCDDCTSEHALAMRQQTKCCPDLFRRAIPIREVALP
jgi:hypothetical protein